MSVDALILALMPVFALLACRTLCTLTAPPVPTYLADKSPGKCSVRSLAHPDRMRTKSDR